MNDVDHGMVVPVHCMFISSIAYIDLVHTRKSLLSMALSYKFNFILHNVLHVPR